jgi:hypothetical protein
LVRWLGVRYFDLSGKQHRQLGDVGGDAPCLVAGEEVRRRATARLLLEVDVSERLPVV